MGIILAVKQPNAYLPILAVRTVEYRTQVTVLWGDSLLFSNSGFSQPEYFRMLLVNWINKPLTWAELAEIPVQGYIYVKRHQPAPLPPTPDAEAHLILKEAKFDAVKGYSVIFQQPPYLFTLFKGIKHILTGGID